MLEAYLAESSDLSICKVGRLVFASAASSSRFVLFLRDPGHVLADNNF